MPQQQNKQQQHQGGVGVSPISPNEEQLIPLQLGLDPEGMDLLDNCVTQGYAIFLMLGISRSGKTQMIKAFHDTSQQDPLLFSHLPGPGVIRTVPGAVAIYSIQKQLANRKAVFVDTAGEHFEAALSDQNNMKYQRSFELLRRLVKNLAGVVAMVDLTKHWGPQDLSHPEFHQQPNIIVWVLQLLLWLHYYDHDGRLPGAAEVRQDIAKLSRRHKIPFPVLILFSKADELQGMAIPGTTHCLNPNIDSPLCLARQHLSSLYNGVLQHVRLFHFDFLRAITVDEDTGVIVNNEPCGTRLTMRWILRKKSYMWDIPTAMLAWLQDTFDRIKGRNTCYQESILTPGDD